jgi:hypothetical protein
MPPRLVEDANELAALPDTFGTKRETSGPEQIAAHPDHAEAAKRVRPEQQAQDEA